MYCITQEVIVMLLVPNNVLYKLSDRINRLKTFYYINPSKIMFVKSENYNRYVFNYLDYCTLEDGFYNICCDDNILIGIIADEEIKKILFKYDNNIIEITKFETIEAISPDNKKINIIKLLFPIGFLMGIHSPCYGSRRCRSYAASIKVNDGIQFYYFTYNLSKKLNKKYNCSTNIIHWNIYETSITIIDRKIIKKQPKINKKAYIDTIIYCN